MIHTSGHFEGYNACQLFYQTWLPEKSPRAVLAMVHGVGEHCGRYNNLVDYLVAHSYAAIGFDHRGHGQSAGQRGHIYAWSDYRSDVSYFLQLVEQLQAGIPVFLYGHSMGSLVVLDYILHTPEELQGAILSGLPIEPAGVAKPYLVAIAKLLSRVWPTFPVQLGLDARSLSRDPAVAKAYQDDPLVHGSVTTRWGTEGLKTLAWVKERAGEIRLPVLLIHGEDDPLNTIQGARRYFEQIAYPDKSLLVYPGSLHEPHNDLDCDQVAADIGQWLGTHLN
jgi:alpha-beta hydrolase superfamily lysophospholipase